MNTDRKLFRTVSQRVSKPCGRRDELHESLTVLAILGTNGNSCNSSLRGGQIGPTARPSTITGFHPNLATKAIGKAPLIHRPSQEKIFHLLA